MDSNGNPAKSSKTGTHPRWDTARKQKRNPRSVQRSGSRDLDPWWVQGKALGTESPDDRRAKRGAKECPTVPLCVDTRVRYQRKPGHPPKPRRNASYMNVGRDPVALRCNGKLSELPGGCRAKPCRGPGPEAPDDRRAIARRWRLQFHSPGIVPRCVDARQKRVRRFDTPVGGGVGQRRLPDWPARIRAGSRSRVTIRGSRLRATAGQLFVKDLL